MNDNPLIDSYFPVLDKGFVALKDFFGSDETIEQAARISYGKGTRKISDTRHLIRYLVRHVHTSPIEQPCLQFHIAAPIDVWRQFLRHRTGSAVYCSVNEYSTRYSVAIDKTQQTDPTKWRLQSSDNKQGSEGYLSKELGTELSNDETEIQELCRKIYEKRLDKGVAREQARKDLPLSTYTEAYIRFDLHNLLHFLRLRLDSHAQEEIREYAKAIASIVKALFPLTWEAFEDYILYARNFSYQELMVLHEMLNKRNHLYREDHEHENQEKLELCTKFGLSKRETSEFLKKIEKPTKKADYSLDISLAKNPENFE